MSSTAEDDSSDGGPTLPAEFGILGASPEGPLSRASSKARSSRADSKVSKTSHGSKKANDGTDRDKNLTAHNNQGGTSAPVEIVGPDFSKNMLAAAARMNAQITSLYKTSKLGAPATDEDRGSGGNRDDKSDSESEKKDSLASGSIHSAESEDATSTGDDEYDFLGAAHRVSYLVETLKTENLTDVMEQLNDWYCKRIDQMDDEKQTLDEAEEGYFVRENDNKDNLRCMIRSLDEKQTKEVSVLAACHNTLHDASKARKERFVNKREPQSEIVTESETIESTSGKPIPTEAQSPRKKSATSCNKATPPVANPSHSPSSPSHAAKGHAKKRKALKTDRFGLSSTKGGKEPNVDADETESGECSGSENDAEDVGQQEGGEFVAKEVWQDNFKSFDVDKAKAIVKMMHASPAKASGSNEVAPGTMLNFLVQVQEGQQQLERQLEIATKTIDCLKVAVTHTHGEEVEASNMSIQDVEELVEVVKDWVIGPDVVHPTGPDPDALEEQVRELEAQVERKQVEIRDFMKKQERKKKLGQVRRSRVESQEHSDDSQESGSEGSVKGTDIKQTPVMQKSLMTDVRLDGAVAATEQRPVEKVPPKASPKLQASPTTKTPRSKRNTVENQEPATRPMELRLASKSNEILQTKQLLHRMQQEHELLHWCAQKAEEGISSLVLDFRPPEPKPFDPDDAIWAWEHYIDKLTFSPSPRPVNDAPDSFFNRRGSRSAEPSGEEESRRNSVVTTRNSVSSSRRGSLKPPPEVNLEVLVAGNVAISSQNERPQAAMAAALAAQTVRKSSIKPSQGSANAPGSRRSRRAMEPPISAKVVCELAPEVPTEFDSHADAIDAQPNVMNLQRSQLEIMEEEKLKTLEAELNDQVSHFKEVSSRLGSKIKEEKNRQKNLKKEITDFRKNYKTLTKNDKNAPATVAAVTSQLGYYSKTEADLREHIEQTQSELHKQNTMLEKAQSMAQVKEVAKGGQIPSSPQTSPQHRVSVLPGGENDLLALTMRSSPFANLPMVNDNGTSSLQIPVAPSKIRPSQPDVPGVSISIAGGISGAGNFAHSSNEIASVGNFNGIGNALLDGTLTGAESSSRTGSFNVSGSSAVWGNSSSAVNSGVGNSAGAKNSTTPRANGSARPQQQDQPQFQNAAQEEFVELVKLQSKNEEVKSEIEDITSKVNKLRKMMKKSKGGSVSIEKMREIVGIPMNENQDMKPPPEYYQLRKEVRQRHNEVKKLRKAWWDDHKDLDIILSRARKQALMGLRPEFEGDYHDELDEMHATTKPEDKGAIKNSVRFAFEKEGADDLSQSKTKSGSLAVVPSKSGSLQFPGVPYSQRSRFGSLMHNPRKSQIGAGTNSELQGTMVVGLSRKSSCSGVVLGSASTRSRPSATFGMVQNALGSSRRTMPVNNQPVDLCLRGGKL